MMDDIHSCSYYCQRPACVGRQRDELRERLNTYWDALQLIHKHAMQGVTDPRFTKDQCALILDETRKLFC